MFCFIFLAQPILGSIHTRVVRFVAMSSTASRRRPSRRRAVHGARLSAFSQVVHSTSCRKPLGRHDVTQSSPRRRLNNHDQDHLREVGLVDQNHQVELGLVDQNDQVAKLKSDDLCTQAESFKVKRKKGFDDSKEKINGESSSVPHAKKEDVHASHSVVSNGDSSLKKSRRNPRKRKDLAPDSKRDA